MHSLLIIKTGALGDVLRTTSILPGLAKSHPDLRVTWLTAHGARELVENHPLVSSVMCVDPDNELELAEVRRALASTRWNRILSFDDEQALCELSSALECERLSGAHVNADQSRTYTADVAPWFDMGLLSKFGKERADELKIANRDSHATLYARMLGVDMAEPELALSEEAIRFGEEFADHHSLRGKRAIGLNTGAGGRWVSKQLSVPKTLALAEDLASSDSGNSGDFAFVVLGGPTERERSAEILAGLAERKLEAIDAGSDNTIGQFAAIVSHLTLLVSSDSLALHVAVARRIPVVAFFAPTSGAEIELFGRGEKVLSTAPDYCTYRSDVDTSTITAERLADAVRTALNVAH